MLFGLILASASIFGKEDWNNLKDKVNDLTQQEETIVSNNILENSNFKATTKPGTIFTEADVEMGAYFVDNWHFVVNDASSFEIYQSANGVYVNNKEGYFSIRQRLDNALGLYDNKEVTLTMSLNDVVFSISGVLSSDNEILLSTNNNVFAVATLIYDMDCLYVNISFKEVGEFTVNWVQLEEGSIFTGYNA